MKKIRTNIFDISPLKRAPFGGSLLVAQPFLRESHFLHAVVALVEHSGEYGCLGMVLNKRTGYRMPDLLPQIRRTPATMEIPVFLGGPVANDRLFYIHNLGSDIIAGSEPFGDGLYVGGKFADVINYVNSGYPTEGHIRFTVGYAGWSPDQLEEELAEGTWAVSDINMPPEDILTGSDDAYWHKVVSTMGPAYRNWLYYPQDLSAN